MRNLLVALLLLAPASAGCLDGSFLEQIRNDLEAEDEFEDRQLLSEEVAFSPTGIADPNKTVEDESDVGSEWNTTVAVPQGTRSLTVVFQIAFENSDASEEVPINPPDGEVRVYIQSPDGERERSVTHTQPAQAGFDFNSPQPGGWVVGMEARGSGTVTFNVDAIVPANPPSS